MEKVIDNVPGSAKASATDESPTRSMLLQSLAPIVPNRLRDPIYHIEDNAMPAQFSAELGRWLFENRDRLVRGGDDAGVQRYNYETTDIDTVMPTELLAPLRRKLIDATANEATLEKLCVPPFDVRYLEMHATLYHHGGHFIWHDDAPGYDGSIVESRRVTFCYYMHADPKMFSGGELEFLDGTAVEPKNNRLCLFHPIQQHRIKRVECWSSHVLHGRWAIMGWVHGDPPEGYVDRIPKLRGRPQGG